VDEVTIRAAELILAYRTFTRLARDAENHALRSAYSYIEEDGKWLANETATKFNVAVCIFLDSSIRDKTKAWTVSSKKPEWRGGPSIEISKDGLKAVESEDSYTIAAAAPAKPTPVVDIDQARALFCGTLQQIALTRAFTLTDTLKKISRRPLSVIIENRKAKRAVVI